MTGIFRRGLRLALMAILLILAVRYAGRASVVADRVTIFLNAGITRDAAEEIADSEAGREDAVSACFFGEVREQNISSEIMESSGTVTEVPGSGNMELLFPECSVLSMNPGGCLIDRETAEELFGSAEAGGQIVKCGGQTYVVCGVLETLQRLLVRRAGSGENTQLTRLVLRVDAAGNRVSCAEQYLMRNGLTGRITDLRPVSVLVTDLCLLAPLLTLIRFSVWLFRGGRARKGLSVLLLLAGFVWLKQFLEIPADLIPTRWADFSFWSTALDAQRQNLILVLGSALSDAQIGALMAAFRSVLCSVLAAGLVLL